MSNENFDNFDDVEDLDDLYVTLNFDGDKEQECVVITIFDVDDKDYIALLPIDEEGNEIGESVYLYKYFEDEDGNPSLDNIVDDDEYNAVADAFDALVIEMEEED